MSLQTVLVRAWVRLTSVLAPRHAERFAARLFLTPRRRPAVPRPVAGREPRRFEIDLDGEHLVGWRWGTEGRRVLLVHGWSGRAADMSAIAAALAARGHEAVTIDMPAHGSSAGKRTNLAIWMRLLPAIARRLGPFDAAVGHSFGAAAITLALAEGLDVARVVLIAPPLGPAHFMDRLRQFIGLPASRVAGMERELVQIVGRPIADFDASRVAAHLAQSALILHDPADDDVPFAHGEAIAAAWRGSAFVPMPGAGHYRILRSGATIDRAVEFIGGTTAGALPAPVAAVR
jgi:alpha-beta hydrolase superfamily lysophospholipase